jgi:excisionase family DNA binding protein
VPCGSGVVAGNPTAQDPFVEQGAGPLHRHQHLVVAADPGQVAGPAATFHMKAAVLVPQLIDDLGEPVGAVAGCQLLPDAVLVQRLDHRQIARLDAGGVQLLQVLGDVHDRRPSSRAVADHLEVLGGELVHHHAAVLAVGDLGDQRRHPAAGQLDAGQVFGLVVGLRVGRNQLYQAVAHGELGSVRIGRSIRIPKQALLDLLATASPPASQR